MSDGYESLPLMVVGDGKSDVAMELTYVMELIRNAHITPLPCVPDYYEGLCSWKGRIIPVVSLQRAGELPETEKTRNGVVIITRVNELECGFLIGNEPRITNVNPRERMEGEIPERLGNVLKIKEAYTDGGQVLPLIDLPETLKNLVVYE